MLIHDTNRTTMSYKKNGQYNWFIFDAHSKKLGRLSVEIAKVLTGKLDVTYNPSQNIKCGVIVINAEKIVISGKKEHDKFYYKHSGTPGGLSIATFKELHSTQPTRIIERSVKGMLPKKVLGRKLFTKLKVYAGPDHPHLTQKPKYI